MGPKLTVNGFQILPKLALVRIISVMTVVMIFGHTLHFVRATSPDKNKAETVGRSRHALLQLIKQNEKLTNQTIAKNKALAPKDEPLEKIFPSSIETKKWNSSSTTTPSPTTTTSSNPPDDPEEMLRKALINHTLANGGEGDLDQLIFSAIPEGSKLVVQTVKIMRTDEHGNPINGSEAKEPVHWDVSLTNATDIEDEYEDEYDDEENDKMEDDKSEKGRSGGSTDLAIAGSHAQANYKAYGESEQEKEKNKKYYHGNDHGKTHKVTHTDTDGLKVKNYKGKEHGLTDFAHSDGHSLNKENERFRDTKRKNKGRRVQGFKRVYHKEEFQRTEHFFDDEEAKRIAESYGLKDAKEQSNHGTKDDDQKYHGVRKEHTDGKKIKHEKGISNGFNKGERTEYKDAEKHKHRTHYDKSQHSPHYNNNQGHYQQQKQNHPNHNYHGSYSHPRNTVRRPNYSPKANNNQVVLTSDDFVGSLAKAPMIASYTVTPYEQDSSTDSSTDDPTVVVVPNSISNQNPHQDFSTVEEPDEILTFFSPRERPRAVTSQIYETVTYPSDFKPGHSRDQRHHTYYFPKYRNTNTNYRPVYPHSRFRQKIGNASLADEELRKNYTNYYRNGNRTYDNERYARNYPTSTVRNTLFGPPKGPGSFSTLVKVMPVKYINLTDENPGQDTDSRQQSINSNQIVSSPVSKSNSSNYVNTHSITFTTSVPYLMRRPPPPRGNWISINIGYPNRHPNHNYGGYPSTRPLTNLVRGVKNKLMQPILRPAYSTLPHLSGNRFDPSKYPPNVVQSTNVNSFSTIPFSTASTQSVNKNSPQKPTTQQGLTQGVLKPYQGTHYNNNNRNPSFSYNGIHRPRTPHSLPPFMNNLMDSVANFFSRISNKESG